MRLAAKLLREEADRRLGLSRRDFLCTAAGTPTAFIVLSLVHAGRSICIHGPRTRREFLALLRHELRVLA